MANNATLNAHTKPMVKAAKNAATVRMVEVVTTFQELVLAHRDGEVLYATSPAHRVLMGVNANPLASARMEVHVIQCMGNAIALVDGRAKFAPIPVPKGRMEWTVKTGVTVTMELCVTM